MHTAGPGVPDMLESLVDLSHSRLTLLLEKTMNIVWWAGICASVCLPTTGQCQGGGCLFPADLDSSGTGRGR